MKIRGIVESGAGKGAFFTGLDWVVRQFEDKVGFRPSPGTLNVRIIPEDLDKLDAFYAVQDCDLVPDDPNWCSAGLRFAHVNGIPAAAVLPGDDVRVHSKDVIELMCDRNVKQSLGIRDGDPVDITFDHGSETMGIYSELYDFASSAGSFEGYVYKGEGRDLSFLPRWSGNLLRQYRALPEDVREEIRTMCDGTIGRAILSLIPLIGEDHEVIENLKPMVKGKMPASPDDFDKH